MKYLGYIWTVPLFCIVSAMVLTFLIVMIAIWWLPDACYDRYYPTLRAKYGVLIETTYGILEQFARFCFVL